MKLIRHTLSNFKNNGKKNQKGITLIALVVTIVVLVILGGVSVYLVLGQNGILNTAKEARKNYAEAETTENTDLVKLDNEIGQVIASSRNEQEVSYYDGTYCSIQKLGRICILQTKGKTYSFNKQWGSWNVETLPDEYKPVYNIRKDGSGGSRIYICTNVN